MTLRLLLRSIDSDKYRAEGAKPTLTPKGILKECLIKKMTKRQIDKQINKNTLRQMVFWCFRENDKWKII